MCSLEHSWRAAGCLFLDNDLYVFSCEHTFPVSCCRFSRLDKKFLFMHRVFQNRFGFFPQLFSSASLLVYSHHLSHLHIPSSPCSQPPTHTWFSLSFFAFLFAIWWFSFQQFSKNIWNLILATKPFLLQHKLSLLQVLSLFLCPSPEHKHHPEQTHESTRRPGSELIKQSRMF